MLEHRIAIIWAEVLETQRFNCTTDFFDLGGTSLLAALIVLELQQRLDIVVALSEFAKHRTVRALALAIESNTLVREDPPLVGANVDGRATPIFGLCGARGYALRMLQLATLLSPDQPLYGLQPPAMSWAHTGLSSIESFASFYIERMRSVQPHGPYQIVGASFGGVVAFEIALQLEALGEPISWLCMLDSERPNASGWSAIDSMHDGHDPDSIAFAHRQALRCYTPSTPLLAPMHYLMCVDRLIEPLDTRDWRSYTAEQIRMQLIPGLHGAFHTSPQREAVIDYLAKLLAIPDAIANSVSSKSLFLQAQISDTHIGCFDADWPIVSVATTVGEFDCDRPRAGVTQLRGKLWFPDVPNSPLHILVFAGRKYLGWVPLSGNTLAIPSKQLLEHQFCAGLRTRHTPHQDLRAFALDLRAGQALELQQRQLGATTASR